MENLKSLNYLPLKETISKNGFIYNQLARKGRFAIYEQRNKIGILYGHEVFEIIISSKRLIAGKFIPAQESFPGNERFGKNAWSVGIDSKRAFQFFMKKVDEENYTSLKIQVA